MPDIPGNFVLPPSKFLLHSFLGGIQNADLVPKRNVRHPYDPTIHGVPLHILDQGLGDTQAFIVVQLVTENLKSLGPFWVHMVGLVPNFIKGIAFFILIAPIQIQNMNAGIVGLRKMRRRCLVG